MTNIVSVDFKNKKIILFKFSIHDDVLDRITEFECSFSSGDYTLNVEKYYICKRGLVSRFIFFKSKEYKILKKNFSYLSKNYNSFINEFYHSLVSGGLKDNKARLKINESYDILREFRKVV
jgi:hypothetical protein